MLRLKHIDFKVLKRRARKLRQNLTPSEIVLCKELRNRKLAGYKFLRQHPIVYNPTGSGSKYFVNEELHNMDEALKNIETY